MTLARLALIGAAVLAAMVAGTTAYAQRCSTDADCQRTGLRGETRCAGEILVIKQYRCVGGACRHMDTRQNCDTRAAGRCIGNVFEARTGRCDALLGRCVQRADRAVCIASCTCRENVLTIATEQCSPNIGCHRGTTVCKNGCTCEPEPRCLDAPAEN